MTSAHRHFIAVVAIFAAVALAPAATAGERMNAGDLDTTLAGITLDGIYADGTYFTEAYHDDHTIRYWDADGADSGRWSIRDGLFCTFYETLQGACFLVERDGDNCFTFFEVDADDATTPPREWTSRGWNRAKPATCSTPPEAAI